MTREEAIEIIKEMQTDNFNHEPEEIVKALDIAIEVLEQEPCEDCISRAEAQKRISIRLYESALNTVDYDCKTSDVFKDIAEKLSTWISEIPSVQPKPKTGHWIPASERLPKAGEYIGDVAKYYLVQNEYGDMLVARYTHSEYWEQMYQLKPIADEIVAWMPLPEPYRAESEENHKTDMRGTEDE